MIAGVVPTLVTESVSVSVSSGETVVATPVDKMAEVVDSARLDELVTSGVVVDVVVTAGVVAIIVLEVAATGAAEEGATTPDGTATCRFPSCLANISA